MFYFVHGRPLELKQLCGRALFPPSSSRATEGASCGQVRHANHCQNVIPSSSYNDLPGAQSPNAAIYACVTRSLHQAAHAACTPAHCIFERLFALVDISDNHAWTLSPTTVVPAACIVNSRQRNTSQTSCDNISTKIHGTRLPSPCTMEAQNEKIDAGTAGLDHYKTRLPTWRYVMREKLLPITRAETPYVALLQERMRTPVLDTYFAMTANLGTHTCFMVALPILFWCGNPFLGRAMTRTLAAGVYLSGFAKDLLCLPRPLSPPLTRITMSGSAALEYGFPSSHSTNAVSVTVFSVLLLRDPGSTVSPKTSIYLQALAYFYAFSIVLGRLYCGMHGFLDVVCGSLLGAAIALGQFYLGPVMDDWLFSSTEQALVLITLVIFVLIRIHPEPADDCPCFDDSVAFAAVVLGVDLGGWHFARTLLADASAHYPGTVPFSISELGWPKVIARILLGVVVVFVWRAIMKPLLLRGLPPIFRLIENLGLDLPRRYFKPASQYQTVPDQRDDDNVIPSARDIPHLLTNLRRRRAISVGPQSEADAYEALAYRQKRRRDSLLSSESLAPLAEPAKETAPGQDYFDPLPLKTSQSRKRSLSLEEFRAQMGDSPGMLSPEAIASPHCTSNDAAPRYSAEDEKDKSELFATVQKPRVRYDVEVITKLVVYCGIGWLAVEGNPILFHYVGLSV